MLSAGNYCGSHPPCNARRPVPAPGPPAGADPVGCPANYSPLDTWHYPRGPDLSEGATAPWSQGMKMLSFVYTALLQRKGLHVIRQRRRRHKAGASSKSEQHSSKSSRTVRLQSSLMSASSGSEGLCSREEYHYA